MNTHCVFLPIALVLCIPVQTSFINHHQIINDQFQLWNTESEANQTRFDVNDHSFGYFTLCFNSFQTLLLNNDSVCLPLQCRVAICHFPVMSHIEMSLPVCLQCPLTQRWITAVLLSHATSACGTSGAGPQCAIERKHTEMVMDIIPDIVLKYVDPNIVTEYKDLILFSFSHCNLSLWISCHSVGLFLTVSLTTKI